MAHVRRAIEVYARARREESRSGLWTFRPDE